MRILFFAPTSLFGRLISFVTRSRFCHVGVEINGKYYEEQGNGLVESPPRDDYAGVYGMFTTADALFDVMHFTKETVGQRYSWTTILADLVASYTPWKWQIEANGEHVCSGFAAWVVCLANPSFFDKVGYQPDSVTPGQLARLLGVK